MEPSQRAQRSKKYSRFRARLKISSENDIFERATHRGPFFGRGFPQNEYRGENFVFGGRTLKMKNAPEFGGKELVYKGVAMLINAAALTNHP